MEFFEGRTLKHGIGVSAMPTVTTEVVLTKPGTAVGTIARFCLKMCEGL